MDSYVPKIQRSLKVLLVEDNLGDVTLVKEAFRASRTLIQITRVKDGQEAMEYLTGGGRFLRTIRPDLILLDLNMPKKSGLEVLDEIKSDTHLANIPVVILSNSKLDTDIHEAYQRCANFYLVKPTDLEDFFTTMRYVEETWLRPVLNKSGGGQRGGPTQA